MPSPLTTCSLCFTAEQQTNRTVVVCYHLLLLLIVDDASACIFSLIWMQLMSSTRHAGSKIIIQQNHQFLPLTWDVS